jgi:hypothetical protein
MVLREIFGPKRNEITGELIRLRNEELNDLHCSPNVRQMIKSRRMGWNGHVARVGESRVVYRVLVGNLKERALGRSGRIWDDNIKIEPKEVGWQCVGLIDLTWDKDKWQGFVKAVMYRKMR